MAGVATVTAGCDEHELEEELSPRVRVELSRPLGNRLAAHALPQPGAPEGRIDQHAHAAVLRQRQDAFFHPAVVDRVVDANEVDRLAGEDLLELRILAREGGGDTDVTYALLGAQLLEQAELDRHVAEVVHLDQVEHRLADALEGGLERAPAPPRGRQSPPPQPATLSLVAQNSLSVMPSSAAMPPATASDAP